MILAVELAGNFEAGTAIWAGAVGALAMLMVIYAGRAMGMTSMDLLRTLGTMMLPKAKGPVVYAVGLMMHVGMGAAFGLVHAGLLHALGPSTDGGAAVEGILIGLAHGMIMTAAMPVMLTMAHPLVKSGEMRDPGVAMTGFGRMTPMGMIMAHGVYGLVTSVIYVGVVG